MGYGQNPINYIGTCVFHVKHNNIECNVLFFITDVNDTKVILGSKACQKFKLVRILCDDKCHCKTMRFEIVTVNEEFPVGLNVPDKTMYQLKPKLPLVYVNTKIDANNPKTHILQLFPDLFEGIGTMENIQVHLDVDAKMEPVVQAPHKMPHSMLEPLKSRNRQNAEIGCYLQTPYKRSY